MKKFIMTRLYWAVLAITIARTANAKSVSLDLTSTASLQFLNSKIFSESSSESLNSPGTFEVQIKSIPNHAPINLFIFSNWNFGVRGRYDFGQDGSENLGFELGLHWLYAKYEFSIPGSNSASIMVRRQGLEFLPAIRLYAIKNNIFSLYIKSGFTCQYTFLKKVTYQNLTSAVDASILESTDENNIKKLGYAINVGLGGALYKNILDINIFCNIWLSTIVDADGKSTVAPAAVSRFLLINKIDPIISLGINLSVDLLPLFVKDKSKEEEHKKKGEVVFVYE